MITLEYGVLLNIILTIASMVFFIAKLDATTKMYKEVFTLELRHVREILESNKQDVKSDIERLEQKQNESNNIKERLALAENSLKSLHHRIDLVQGTFE